MKILIAMLLTLFSLTAMSMTSIEGKVVFDKGRYLIAEMPVVGMSLQEMRKYEQRQVKVQGVKRQSGALEIYKISVKTDDGYETDYDWDVVNQSYYGSGL